MSQKEREQFRKDIYSPVFESSDTFKNFVKSVASPSTGSRTTRGAETPSVRRRNDLYMIMRGQAQYKPQKVFTNRASYTSLSD